MPTYIKYTKELLEPIVQNSKSISEVLQALGLVVKGGNFKTIKRNLIKFDINFEHFEGQSWSKGLSSETCEVIKSRAEKTTKHTVETSLVYGSYISSSTLRRLYALTLTPIECVECKVINTYNDKPITLHIDHINGDNMDNRISNLRYLCPNCHSQTDNFGSKNKRSSKSQFYKPILNTRENSCCLICSKTTNNWKYKYCSYECRDIGIQKIVMSTTEIYDLWIKNEKNYSKTSREVGISDNAIKKRFKRQKLI